MKENIETKDVQRTEYLDKNGLDMLWAKVKENTRNQVEVERDRATTQENRIIDTKADKSELHSSYVSNSTFTALQEKVAANTDAISDKQDVGNYLSYKTLNNEGYYEIPDVRIPGNGGNTKTDIDSQSISVNCDYPASHTTITCDGISNTDNNANHVYATDGSIADLTQYAKKSESVDNTALAALEQKVTANTTAIEGKQDAGKYIPYKEIEGGLTYYLQDSYNIMCQKGFSTTSSNYDYAAINYNCVKVAQGRDYYTLIDKEQIEIKDGGYARAVISASGIFSRDGNNDFNFELTRSGITLHNGDDNHVLTSNASTIDITEYAKKSEITAGGNVDDVQVNGVSVVENKIANIKPATKENLGVVKVGDGLNVTDGTISVDKSSILVDLLSYGVEWDTTVADPACTRIGNMSYHKSLPIQSEYKGCLVKNGKVNYYLDPNDWSKKADGTPSVLDGTDGDVMVHIPKFYGKSGSNGNKRWVRIATTKIDPSWVEIPEMFVSAYKITTYTDSGTSKVASVVNTSANYRGGTNNAGYDQYLTSDKFRTDLGKPRTNVSRATMRTNANNSGQELLCYEFYKWVFYWAYVIEYANFNSQKEFNSELTSDGYHQGGLGPGITTWNGDWGDYNEFSPITPCGYTNEFGNFSGTKKISIAAKTLYSNRWRGFENPFGDIWTNLDGIVLKADSDNSESKVYTTSDSSKFGDDLSVMNIAGIEVAAYGYIKEFNLGETGEIIPKLTGGSESTYKCDYHQHNSSFTGNRALLVGGYANADSYAGLSYFSSAYSVYITTSTVGFRSVVRA